MRRLSLLLVGLLALSPTYAFEKPDWCDKAVKKSEKMVCGDEGLSASAIALDEKWGALKATNNQDDIDKAKDFLHLWTKEIFQRCTNKSCIAAAYEVAINNELLVIDGEGKSENKDETNSQEKESDPSGEEENAAKDEPKPKQAKAAKEPVVDVTKIAGKTRAEAETVLGAPDECETSMHGDKCRYLKSHTEIVYIDGKADWITVGFDDEPYDPAAIVKLGFKQEPPSFQNEFAIRWEGIDGLLEASLFPGVKGKAAYAYIKAATP